MVRRPRRQPSSDRYVSFCQNSFPFFRRRFRLLEMRSNLDDMPLFVVLYDVLSEAVLASIEDEKVRGI